MPFDTRYLAAYGAEELRNYYFQGYGEKRRLLKANHPPPNEMPHMSESQLSIRLLLRSRTYVLVFKILHGLWSLYILVRQTINIVSYRVRSALYYRHVTPEHVHRDIMGLNKRPKHLSAILKMEENHIERLIDEAAELALWCAFAEISTLSVYEKTGVLKKHMPQVYDRVIQKFNFYFTGQHPSLSVTSPNGDACSSPTVDENNQQHLKLHLISAEDGRESIFELTRTLANECQKGKLSLYDISLELVDSELSEGTMPEPDLLILFSPYIELSSYPPWQIRLTEIFCLQDNRSFGYLVFLEAIRKYATAQMRNGK